MPDLQHGAVGETLFQHVLHYIGFDAAGDAEPRAITIGIKGDIMTEVKTGLTEGERVVVREIGAVAAKSTSALTARPVH